MKKAIVIGSTGLVGSQLVQLLLQHAGYSEIISLARRESGVKHPKLTEFIVDFDKPDTWSDKVHGDVLFSAMGTTIAKAKTRAEQYKVDFSYQFNTAEIAARNGVPSYVLVSAAGANPKSPIFYSNMKGKLE
ncbi:MAG TPA: NAD-dependent epimerase/dehydratase family protein, partial [Paludibacter sp.]|nr:NAD-dependent epimerase/dehydratase family protein [Paludibacter sp.]